MTSLIVLASVGLALLLAGGELVVRGATGLAFRLGISPLAVGLTVVAFGTSAPELVVSLDAAISGANDVSLGNIVGSNICNIALILGVSALLKPVAVHARLIQLDVPLMVLVSFALLAMLLDGSVGRVEGAVLLLGFVAYVAFTYLQSRKETAEIQETIAGIAPVSSTGVAMSAVLLTAGLAALLGGGHLLVGAAVDLAVGLGLSEAIVGLTIVAIGTSLPELVTSIVASIRGQGDIAAGNVVGSCIFNILGILGITATVNPLAQGDVGWVDLLTMTGLAVVSLPFLFTRLRLSRWEGAALLGVYVAYIVWLLAR
jgi:cation:H+ antiporter